jgi:oxygen-independent coproporphyrinogen-3 oxidase
MPPFSAYVHLPYCLRRCPYCDFNTYAVRSVPEERYVAALVSEIDAAAGDPVWKERPVGTVFFGGGTPSLFSPESLGRVLEALDRRFGIEAGAEITMEANPGTLEGSAAARLAGWRAAGINRLSLGVQSFNERHLATLGRLHGRREVFEAVAAARKAGFENLSVDLIFAVPGQTRAEWREDLAAAVSLETDHISAYGLTYEEGTPMTGLRDAGRVIAMPEDDELDMLEDACTLLAAAGLARYEISNFARPGRESRHNLNYWLRGDYLGLGAGAHGFADDPTALGGGTRYANQRFPEIYMSAGPGRHAAGRETLERSDAIAETVLLGLRLAEGISFDAFRRRFAEDPHSALPRLAEFVRTGLALEDEKCFRLSATGLRLADSVIGELCIAHPSAAVPGASPPSPVAAPH